MPECARGCTDHGRHITACLCTPECPEHPNHCDGCQPRPADVGHYCQKCATRFHDALTAIPDLVTQVAQLPGGRLIPHHAAGDATRHATNPTRSSPSPAWDLADEAIMWASSWAWIVAGRPGYDPTKYTRTGIPARDLTASITHISNRLTQALTDHYHPDLYEETLAMSRHLATACAENRYITRIKEPCPDCNQRALTRDRKTGHVECRNHQCRHAWTDTNYRALTA